MTIDPYEIQLLRSNLYKLFLVKIHNTNYVEFLRVGRDDFDYNEFTCCMNEIYKSFNRTGETVFNTMNDYINIYKDDILDLTRRYNVADLEECNNYLLLGENIFCIIEDENEYIMLAQKINKHFINISVI